MHTDQVDDAFVFAPDLPISAARRFNAQKPWRILIVDDNQDVHAATVLALRDVVFNGRGVEFVHAYSAQQASARLRHDGDIALVLLDVVMETQDAGLRLARHLRDDLDDHQVQIVLRTGQPGNALERDVIVDYEINDYLSKGALTGTQLFATVIASLRAYESLGRSKAQQEVLLATQSRVRELESRLDQRGKQNDQELRDAETRWRGALDDSADGGWDVNFETGLVGFSRRWKRANGYPEESPDLHIAGWKNLIHPDDLPQVMTCMRDYLAGKTSTFSCDHRSLHQDGSWHWVHDRGIVVKRSATGKPVQMVGTHTHIAAPLP